MEVSHTIRLRVRYHETDGQGRVHHAQYLNYFERGRVELLRSLGHSYREFEESGLLLVVTEMNVRYFGAAVFDDELLLTTKVVRARGVRIEHNYLITSSPADGEEPQPVVEGQSIIACIDRAGKVRPLPGYLRSWNR
jgi:acyl-CoA thioester hydrolase